MTREIALHCMKSYSELHSDLCELCPIYGQTGSDHCFEDALQYVIGMLEQEPILDKIRAEIEQGYCEVNNDYDRGRNYGLHMATQIIDKYKVEQEKNMKNQYEIDYQQGYDKANDEWLDRIDKIRAEIEDMKAPDYGFAGFEDFYMCQSEVLQIIDKYKAESEE